MINIGKSQASWASFVLFIFGFLSNTSTRVGAVILYVLSIIVALVWHDGSSKIIKWIIIILDVLAIIVTICSFIK